MHRKSQPRSLRSTEFTVQEFKVDRVGWVAAEIDAYDTSVLVSDRQINDIINFGSSVFAVDGEDEVCLHGILDLVVGRDAVEDCSDILLA